jgi:hypothetical protein
MINEYSYTYLNKENPTGIPHFLVILNWNKVGVRSPFFNLGTTNFKQTWEIPSQRYKTTGGATEPGGQIPA